MPSTPKEFMLEAQHIGLPTLLERMDAKLYRSLKQCKRL
jgi:hypothetical protein